MKSTSISLSLLAASVLSASAQTAAKPAVAHTAAPVHKTAAAAPAACATLPPMDKVPALPAGVTNCAKPLYTLTKKADIVFDYVSPMVSEETRNALAPPPLTISLNYIDTKVGTGELAKPGKYYTVNYTGYTLDGSKFDSSEGKDPLSFPYGQHRVIAGWDTGFEGMRVGGKRRLFVPYQLAYGEQGHPPAIPARAMLIFDVEFVAQGDSAPAPKAPPAPAAAPAPDAKPATPPPASSTTPPATAKPEAK